MDNSPWNEILTHGVARVASPLPKFVWRDLYASFASFAEVASHLEYADIFDIEAKEWQAESGLRLHFSGYFSPYYRNRVGQSGRDNKKVIQFCEPYYRYLCRSQPQLFEMIEFRVLVDRMMAVLYSSLASYTPLVHALSGIDHELAENLLQGDLGPPVAIRLISYQGDDYYFTNPHVDKSAITVILDTDEPNDRPCLVFAPHGRESTPPLSEFAPVLTREGEALAFLGAAPREANHRKFLPAGHAVRRLEGSGMPSVRNVAIFFWLLPGIDLARFNTAIPFIDDIGQARPSMHKHKEPKAG